MIGKNDKPLIGTVKRMPSKKLTILFALSDKTAEGLFSNLHWSLRVSISCGYLLRSCSVSIDQSGPKCT